MGGLYLEVALRNEKHPVEAKAEANPSSDRYLPLWAMVEQNWAWAGHRVYTLQAEASRGVQAGKTSARDSGALAKCIL